MHPSALRHRHTCINTNVYKGTQCLCHPATPSTVRFPSLHPHPPPPLILKGQGSSLCQKEFIHSSSITNVILTKSAVRVGECHTLVKITSSGLLFFFSFVNFCLCKYVSSSCVFFLLLHKYMQTYIYMIVFVVHLLVCVSDFLAGEKKKPSNAIFPFF